MSRELKVIGIDPGPTPGIFVLKYENQRLLAADPIQCSSRLAPGIVAQLLFDGVCTYVQIEAFVVGRRATRSSSAYAGSVTRQLIGDLRRASREAYSVVERNAGQVKLWATDERLDAAGLLAPTKGMRHARDAARHALFCAVKDGGVPDPLSTRKD